MTENEENKMLRMARRRRKTMRLMIGTVLLIGMLAATFAGGFWLGRENPAKPVQTARVHSKAKSSAKPAKPERAQADARPPKVADQTPSPEQAALTQMLTGLDFSGTALAYHDGQLVASVTSRYANAQTKTAPTVDTMYAIDSLQKCMTAGLVMHLVDEGKLSLTTPVGQYYPRLAKYPQITVEHLLRMNSGLSTNAVVTPHYTDDAALIQANLDKLIIRPSTIGQYNYAPVNYVLLAGLCEKVTGQTYEQLFTMAYINRLGLTHTRFAYALTAADPIAIGYHLGSYDNPMGASQDEMHAELGTGQVYMSAGDLWKVVSDLAAGSWLGQTRQAVYQAKGSNIYSGGVYNMATGYRANGSGYGFMSTFNVSKDGRSGIVVLSNMMNKATTTPTINKSREFFEQQLVPPAK